MTYCFSNVKVRNIFPFDSYFSKKEAFGAVDSIFKKTYIIKNFNLFHAIERSDAERVKALLKPDRINFVMVTQFCRQTDFPGNRRVPIYSSSCRCT